MDKPSTQQIIELLKQNMILQNSGLFKDRDQAAITEILKIIHISQAGSDEMIFKKGEEGDTIVLILQGSVGVYIKDKEGKEIKLAEVGGKSFIGEMAIIDETVRMATVKTTSECLLATIHNNDFWAYFQQYPSLARNILKGINQRLREVNTNFIAKVQQEKEILLEFNRELEKKVEETTDKLRQRDIRLLEMDRIAGISTLAAGIAHEINNPLGFVRSSINAVKKGNDKMAAALTYWDDKPLPQPLLKEYKEYLDEKNLGNMAQSMEGRFGRIKKGIERIMTIVNSLRGFSRVDMEQVGKININQSIDEAVDILDSQENKIVEFSREFQELPHMVCNTNEIHQCLLHTIRNAMDAVNDKGAITIATAHDQAEDAIIIRITDNGKGMSPEVLRQAFNPFFTTKEVGSGTGVGLTITEKAVTRHGGKVVLSSEEGKGTTVTMTLPVRGKEGAHVSQ